LECFGRALPPRTEPGYFARRGRSAASRAASLDAECTPCQRRRSRHVAPAHPDAASSSYSALPSSQPQALARCLSQYLSAGTKHVRWRDLVIIPYFILCPFGATQQRPAVANVGCTCGRLDLRISKTCRWSPHSEIPTLTRIHTLVGSHCEPSEKCMYPSDMYSGLRANQILDMPGAFSPRRIRPEMPLKQKQKTCLQRQRPKNAIPAIPI